MPASPSTAFSHGVPPPRAPGRPGARRPGAAALILPLLRGPLLQGAALLVTLAVGTAVLPAAGAAVLGYDTYAVAGGSMEPAVREGSLVIARRVDPASIAAGDVITYRHPDRPTIPVTHRVIQVFDDQGGRHFQTKGDANATPDPALVSGLHPISRMTLTVPFAGTIIDTLRTLPGQIALILLPALILATRVLRRPLPATAPPARTHVNPAEAPLAAPPATEWSPTMNLAVPSARGRFSLAGLRSLLARFTLPRLPRVALGQRPGPAQATGETERMQRLSRYLEAHAALTREVDHHVQQSLAPLRELVERHALTAARLEANLDRQLQPVREYADELEANVQRLFVQLQAQGPASNATLAQQFERDRARAGEVRANIERMKAPLRAAIAREAAAMDALFAGFDPDIAQLEQSLVEQRRDLLRVVSGLRSDQLGEAVAFLRDRSAELAGLADAGIAELDEIEATLRVTAERMRGDRRGSAPLARVLGALDPRAAATAAAPMPRSSEERPAEDRPTRAA